MIPGFDSSGNANPKQSLHSVRCREYVLAVSHWSRGQRSRSGLSSQASFKRPSIVRTGSDASRWYSHEGKELGYVTWAVVSYFMQPAMRVSHALKGFVFHLAGRKLSFVFGPLSTEARSKLIWSYTSFLFIYFIGVSHCEGLLSSPLCIKHHSPQTNFIQKYFRG